MRKGTSEMMLFEKSNFVNLAHKQMISWPLIYTMDMNIKVFIKTSREIESYSDEVKF